MAQPPVGIDLGTTYSALAIIGAAGRPEIVPNQDGERLTASAVFFQEGGPILVGEAAVRAARGFPDRVVRWVKREMGDGSWKKKVNGRSYGAIEITSIILRKLKQDAERTLGPIQSAVVTVPAYFDEHRRRATIEAGKLAGLEVLRIINEPTAAAIAYASSVGQQGTVMVYDFGGGTFDASLVRVREELAVEVLASDGDHQLGGYDLDRALAAHYNSRLQEEKGVQVPEDEDNGEWLGVIDDAERDKRDLSKRSGVRGRIQWAAHLLNVDVERPLFEDMIKDYVVRTQMLVENVLSQANVGTEDVDAVLLIGGSTRIPLVRRMLAEMFECPIQDSISPDEAVALGAAIQAGIIMNERGIGDISPEAAARLTHAEVRDVTPHGYGTMVVDMSPMLAPQRGRPREVNEIMIKKNTPLPATRKETFYTLYDGQRSVDCTITQGEETDPHFVKMIAQGEELRLPEGLPAQSPIEVAYRYDLDGCMECVFTEPSSGRSKKFMLSRDELGAPPQEQQGDDIAFDELFIE